MKNLSIQTDFKSGIYQIKNLVNNKIYIGSSKNLYNRIARHKADLTRKVHSNKYLQSSIDKYGLDNFESSIIEYCSENELTDREQYYINELKPDYNLILNVVRQTLSQESRNKISKSLKEAYRNGTKLPSSQNTTHKAVIAYNIYGIPIEEYNSVTDAAKDQLVPETSISLACKSNYRTCAGFIWKFKGDKFIFIPKLIVINIKTKQELHFFTLRDAEKFLNLRKGCITAFLCYTKTGIYKSKYQFKIRKHG